MLLHPSRFRFWGLVAAAVTIGNWASTASAVLQVYDGFNYADTTSILGGNGGGGWSDTWTKPGNAAATEIATTPGSSYQTLPVVGNKVTLTGQQAAGIGNSSFTFRYLQFGLRRRRDDRLDQLYRPTHRHENGSRWPGRHG